VLDAEALAQHRLELAAAPVAVVALGDEHVGGQGGEAARDLPDVGVCGALVNVATMTIAPSTPDGSSRRRTDSTPSTAASTTRPMPLICADSTSARRSPNVNVEVTGRSASRAATSASAIEPASVSMWAASDSSATGGGAHERTRPRACGASLVRLGAGRGVRAGGSDQPQPVLLPQLEHV